MLNLVSTSLQQCSKYKQSYEQHLVTQCQVVQNSSSLQNLEMAENQQRIMNEIIIHQGPKILQHSNMYRILIFCISCTMFYTIPFFTNCCALHHVSSLTYWFLVLCILVFINSTFWVLHSSCSSFTTYMFMQIYQPY